MAALERKKEDDAVLTQGYDHLHTALHHLIEVYQLKLDLTDSDRVSYHTNGSTRTGPVI